jgi:perosamine synthetase
VTFSRPLADGRNYPQSSFPVLPQLGGSHFQHPRQCPAGVGSTLMTTHARYGLAAIARAELEEGDLILLPAYHCPALVEPFLWAGCRVTFYSMNPDLSPKMADFENQLKAARAVVLVRYFGFTGNTQELAILAREQGCMVIEDLAHAPFIEKLYGDFGVTSLPKFYPVTCGGEIWIAADRGAEALSHFLGDYRQSPLRWQLSLVLQKLRQRLPAESGEETDSTSTYTYFQEEGLREPLSARALAETGKHDANAVIVARRENYQFLGRLLEKSSIGSPLYARLGETDVPYVFPFILDDANTFDKIRNAGIPLFRWEELAPSACEVSADYRSKLIQIPCHQDVSDEDLGLIEATFRRVEP